VNNPDEGKREVVERVKREARMTSEERVMLRANEERISFKCEY